MIRPAITLRRKHIVIDVDTQRDFLLADGRACVKNHRRVLSNIRRVLAWARLKNIRVLSTVRLCDERTGDSFCAAGTDGQKKISYTIRKKHTSFPPDGNTDLPRDIFRNHDQIILHKRCTDPFDEPRADRMLSELRATDFIIIGTVTEGAVKATALGLLARRKNVTILVDAVGCHDRDAADIAIRQLDAKGAKLIHTAELLGPSHLRCVGACRCSRCRAASNSVAELWQK